MSFLAPSVQIELYRLISYIIYSMRISKMETDDCYSNEQDRRETREYHRVSEQEKEALALEVFEKGTSIRQAALKVGLKNSTAKLVIRRERKLRKTRSVARRNRENPETIPPQVVQGANLSMAPQTSWANFWPQNNLSQPSYFPNENFMMVYYYLC